MLAIMTSAMPRWNLTEKAARRPHRRLAGVLSGVPEETACAGKFGLLLLVICRIAPRPRKIPSFHSRTDSYAEFINLGLMDASRVASNDLVAAVPRKFVPLPWQPPLHHLPLEPVRNPPVATMHLCQACGDITRRHFRAMLLCLSRCFCAYNEEKVTHDKIDNCLELRRATPGLEVFASADAATIGPPSG
jgi:hypothetical protein